MLNTFTILFLIFLIPILNSCGMGADARQFPPEPEKRVEKNLSEGRGFRLSNLSTKPGGGNFEFASSNELWRATLDTIDFMPLSSANYSGGIIITDGYSGNSNESESIKISIRFLTNEIRSDALDIKIFLKQCSDNQSNCTINQNNTELVAQLKTKILKEAAKLEKEIVKKNKKDNPYVGTLE